MPVRAHVITPVKSSEFAIHVDCARQSATVAAGRQRTVQRYLLVRDPVVASMVQQVVRDSLVQPPDEGRCPLVDSGHGDERIGCIGVPLQDASVQARPGIIQGSDVVPRRERDALRCYGLRAMPVVDWCTGCFSEQLAPQPDSPLCSAHDVALDSGPYP